MTDFEFTTVSKIICQYGATEHLGEIISAQFNVKTVLIVTDSDLKKVGILEKSLQSLAKSKLQVHIYDGVIADPPESIILSLGKIAAQNIDLVIGFGGGSSLDAAKLAAVLATKQQPLAEMYGIGNVTATRLPLVLIPTTAGTGSEVTPISIVTTGETTKSGIVSPVLYADCAILDAELTLGLPPNVTAATGIDAMVHAIEAYTSKHKKNPISDALAIKALTLLYQYLPIAYQDGKNVEARKHTLLGAMLAGQAFANAPVAAVHALAYPLGGIFHLPHGLSNALVLPHVLAFNRPKAEGAYAELFNILCPDATGSISEKAKGFVDLMQTLCVKVDIAKQLRDYNISHNELPRLAEDAMLQERLLVNNPRNVTYQDALNIYEQAW